MSDFLFTLFLAWTPIALGTCIGYLAGRAMKNRASRRAQAAPPTAVRITATARPARRLGDHAAAAHIAAVCAPHRRGPRDWSLE